MIQYYSFKPSYHSNKVIRHLVCTHIHFHSHIFFDSLPNENVTFLFDTYLRTARKTLFDALDEMRCFQSISSYNKALLCPIVNVMIPYLPISSFTEPKNDHYWMSKMTCIDLLSIDVSKMIYIL